MKMYALFILLVSLSGGTFAQQAWELKRKQEGIEVYTRKLDNDRYKEIRVLCEIRTTPAKLSAFLQDIPNQHTWSYGAKQGFVIKRESGTKFTYWAEIELPWPLSNRDVVVEMTFKDDESTGNLLIQAVSVPNVLPVIEASRAGSVLTGPLDGTGHRG